MSENIVRHDGRAPGELRAFEAVRGFTEMAAGSVLMSMGKTKVLCTVSVDDRVPPWLRGKGSGWVSAEYALLPGATSERNAREAVRGKQTGRTVEIQRLIGRSLRSVVDLERLGERQLLIDCDVLQADGGTRTAAITGSYIALVDAVGRLEASGRVAPGAITGALAAISVGIVSGTPVVDLDYYEDAQASVDMNLVMTDQGTYVEIQGTAEGLPYTKAELVTLLQLGERGISELIAYARAQLQEPV
ncbi:MAG: ribonuclease PH [Ferrimicrobium sp.]